MVMEASRAEYLADDKYRAQLGSRESSTSHAEPSSSGASEGNLEHFILSRNLVTGNGVFDFEVGLCVLCLETTGPSGSESKLEGGREQQQGVQDTVLSSSMEMVLSMGFSYLQVIEAYSIFGEDVDSIVCYLLETGSSSRRKGKAAE